MNRNSDILFKTEYIKNALYFATIKQGRVPENSPDTHYFCIDNELIYENYYSDFGPLNLSCIYKYCKILHEKLTSFLTKHIIIVHYTSDDPRKKANAAFLMASYGILYLNFTPNQAFKPLTINGQYYRPFQDATQGKSEYTINIMDCLQALCKARDIGFYNFNDFNVEQYDKLNTIQGGDLNWIVPGKYLAFIGPVDYSVSLFHPPDMYVDYFLDNNVKAVIRLNRKFYDENVFTAAGILHYDLFFCDGSTPRKHILLKFLQISEELDGAIAVHCKAGLGRTGTLIGCYLIKHYRMTAREAIAWMRICRPGSVIGHQQQYLEELQAWLIKQGNLYRRRLYQDIDRLPTHEFGIYSIAERRDRQKPFVISKSPSPPRPLPRQIRSELPPAPRPRASKIRGALHKSHENEEFELQLKSINHAQKSGIKQTPFDPSGNAVTKTVTGYHGLTRTSRSASRTRTNIPIAFGRHESTLLKHEKGLQMQQSMPNPVAKNLIEVKNILMNNQYMNEKKESQLKASLKITPQFSLRIPNITYDTLKNKIQPQGTNYSSKACKDALQSQNRRRLGRSPSPSPIKVASELSRATNTPTQTLNVWENKSSRNSIKEALSKLKLSGPRDGSVGGASLGARRAAPMARRAPSVRSDERPLATQGDLLNSVKFQRTLRKTNTTEIRPKIMEKTSSTTPILKPSARTANSNSGSIKPMSNNQSSSKDKLFPAMLRGLSRARNNPPSPHRSPD